MDCLRYPNTAAYRRTRAAAWPFMALAPSLWLAVGCTTVPDNNPYEAVPPGVQIKPGEEAPKREPRFASTFVAFGDMRARTAGLPNTPDADRSHLREEAQTFYEKALAKEPKCLEAYLGMARLSLSAGDYDQAVMTYRKAAEKLPDAACLWFELGMCQARHKDWTPAAENLRTAVRLDPTNTGYAKTLAFTLARGGRFDESFEVFKKVAGEPQAHYNVARMLYQVNQEELCKQHLHQAIEQKPDLVAAQEFLDELQATHSPDGKHVASVAFEDLEEAAQENPGRSVPSASAPLQGSAN